MARLEDKIEKAILPLIDMYSQIEMDLLIKIASHFSHNEEFLNSDYWRIKKLDEMGLFNQEIIEYIARYSNKTKSEVIRALNEIGIDTMNLDNLNRLFEDEVLKVNPKKLSENYTIRNIINFAYNELSNRLIQMSSKIEQYARDAYLNVIEKAYLETSMGTHSYQESIRSALDQLGNRGLRTLDYKTTDPSGNVTGIRHYDITSTVRREVLTAARQLSNNINMEVANELECEYVYLSEHIRCRPEHFHWQGTIIKREDLVKVTDYGSITGLAGINCAHYFEPYFGDARGNDLKKISKQEATEQYNLSQKQRYLERGIRKWKRKANIFKANNDKDAYVKSIRKVNEWQNELKGFSEANHLRREYTREYVSNYKEVRVNLKPSKAVVEILNNSGIKADDSLSKMNGVLLRSNSIQLNKLIEKYNMKDFYEKMDTTYYCGNASAIAYVEYPRDMNFMNIASSYDYFKDKDYLGKLTKEKSDKKWFMPCDEKCYNIYAMTHEFGHTLEMKLYKKYNPTGNNIGYAHFSDKVKMDIISIAKQKNNNFDYFSNISKYGDRNSKEFFAEVFANLECGKPNELGKAMKEYLKREGMIK